MQSHYMSTVNVQVRLPEQILKGIDTDVKAGMFSNRSDAIRTIVSFYEMSKKRKDFTEMLERRFAEIKNGEFVSISELERELR